MAQLVMGDPDGLAANDDCCCDPCACVPDRVCNTEYVITVPSGTWTDPTMGHDGPCAGIAAGTTTYDASLGNTGYDLSIEPEGCPAYVASAHKSTAGIACHVGSAGKDYGLALIFKKIPPGHVAGDPTECYAIVLVSETYVSGTANCADGTESPFFEYFGVPLSSFNLIGTNSLPFLYREIPGGSFTGHGAYCDISGGAITVDSTVPQRNEQQKVFLSQYTLTGTFSLTFDGQTASGLSFGISAASLQSALEGLSSIGSGNVSVTDSGASGEYNTRLVEFTGALAATNVSLMTGGTSGVTCDKTDEQQTLQVATGTPLSGSLQLTFNGQTTPLFPAAGSLAWNASAAQVQTALENLSTGGVGNFNCTGGPLPTAVVINFQGTLADANQTLITVTNTLVVGGTYTVVTNVEGGTVIHSSCSTPLIITLIQDGC